MGLGRRPGPEGVASGDDDHGEQDLLVGLQLILVLGQALLQVLDLGLDVCQLLADQRQAVGGRD